MVPCTAAFAAAAVAAERSGGVHGYGDDGGGQGKEGEGARVIKGGAGGLSVMGGQGQIFVACSMLHWQPQQQACVPGAAQHALPVVFYSLGLC